MSFRQSQSDNTTDSPSPNSVFSFFPKYMSNSHRYPDFDLQQNQNFKPHLIGLFFMYWHSRLLPLNLHVCSSIDWWGNTSVSGQTEVGVSMHDHIAHYLPGIGSEG